MLHLADVIRPNMDEEEIITNYSCVLQEPL